MGRFVVAILAAAVFKAPMSTLDVLYEDNHLLAVNQPAGLATMGVVPMPSLLATAKQYVKERYQKPGNVYLGAMSRLDAPGHGHRALPPHVEGGGSIDRAIPHPRGRQAVLGDRHRPRFPTPRSLWIILLRTTSAIDECTSSTRLIVARRGHACRFVASSDCRPGRCWR